MSSAALRILAHLAEQEGGIGHRFSYMDQSLVSKGYVVKIGRGVYQLTVEGFKALDAANGVERANLSQSVPVE